MSSFNLKTIIHNWFDYKNEDDTNRPVWIEKEVRNYKKGKWGVGEI